jgi:hypothetical protein
MTARILPLFSARGKAKSLDSDITATTRRAIDKWLCGLVENPRIRKADNVRAAEIREALKLKMPPSDDAIAWLRRRARRPTAECGWLARAALEELER